MFLFKLHYHYALIVAIFSFTASASAVGQSNIGDLLVRDFLLLHSFSSERACACLV